MDLSLFPEEIFAVVIEQLVLMIGNCKAVRLRTVNRRFNKTILQAVFVQQVISFLDPDDAATRIRGLTPPAMGRLLLATSKIDPGRNNMLSGLARIIEDLDDMETEVSEAQRHHNHEVISEAFAQHWNTNLDPLQCLKKGGEKLSRYRPVFQDKFCASISLGNLSLIQRLLEDNECSLDTTVNGHSSFFGLPLPIACAWGHTEVVKYLLSNGANPHQLSSLRSRTRCYSTCDDDMFLKAYRSSHGSPLRAAALAGHKDIVNILLQPEYIIADKDERLRIVHVAARGGHEGILLLICEAFGISLESRPDIMRALLWEAVRYGHEAVICVLLQKGGDPNQKVGHENESSLLQLAAGYGRTAVVRLLLEHGADIPYDVGPGGSAIRTSAFRGHEETVFTLREYGADLCIAFQAAVDGCQNHLLKRLLVEQKFDLNRPLNPRNTVTEGNSALVVSAWKGFAAIVRTLVEAGVAPNDDDLEHDAVFQAWKMGRFHVYNILLRFGAEDKAMPESEAYPLDENRVTTSGFLIDERTCEWAGKY